ncbi:MAG: lytic transglycosylase domain-containing protein [Pseudobdellovibrionaceae bacterium]
MKKQIKVSLLITVFILSPVVNQASPEHKEVLVDDVNLIEEMNTTGASEPEELFPTETPEASEATEVTETSEAVTPEVSTESSTEAEVTLVPKVEEVKPKVRKPLASELQRQARLEHAQELLGSHYKKSAVRSGEKVKKINRRIYQWVRSSLPKKHKGKHQKIAQAIIDESMKYGFDPVLILSMIRGESSFNPDCKGSLDEIGLMQLRPATAKWIAEMSGMKWEGRKSLFNPVTNIRLGTAFVAHLREKYDSHARLYLAAYNMGAGNVDKVRSKKVWPKIYPIHIMKYYVEFYNDLDKKQKVM